MPSHKISLTHQGFKVLSNDIYIDAFSIFLVGGLLLYGETWNFDKLIFVTVAFLISAGFYVYYNYRTGYLYSLSFIYQILLYFLITPSIYISLGNIFLTFLFTFPFFYKGNPFQRIYFPLGLYMSLINSSLGVLEINFHILKSPILSLTGEEFQKISTIFWKLEFSDFFYFHSNTLAPLEKAYTFSILGLGVLIFREYDFWLDMLAFLFCLVMVSGIYNFEVEFYLNQILSLSVTWSLFYFGPGRNFGFTHSYTFLALGLTGILLCSIWIWKANLPSIVFLALYFVLQTFLYILHSLWKEKGKNKVRQIK